MNEPTLQEQLDLKIADCITRGDGVGLKMYITTLIEKTERKARLEELNNLYDGAETPEQYDTCDVVHDHRIAERIRELSGEEN